MQYQRSKIQDQKFKTILHFNLSFCILIFAFLFFSFNLVNAEESSPSADIQQKLDQLKQGVASKAAKLKTEVNKKLTNKVYVGIIQSKSNDNLTLAAKGGTRMISVNQDTEYQNLNPKSKALNFSGLREEATVAAIGDLDETGVLTAKKVFLLSTTTLQPKTHLWGKVTSTATKSIVVEDKNSHSFEVLTDKNTGIKLGKEDFNFKEIGKDQVVIVSGFLNEDSTIEASLIFVIPGDTLIEPSATPSASIKTSPKPSVKASIKPSVKPSPTKSPLPSAN